MNRVLPLLLCASLLMACKSEPKQEAQSTAATTAERAESAGPAVNAALLTRLQGMVADPEAAGAQCLSASTGKSCAWEGGEDFESAEIAWRSNNDYTLNITNPTFELTDLGAPMGTIANAGNLTDAEVSEVTTNTGRQFTIQSAEAVQRLRSQ